MSGLRRRLRRIAPWWRRFKRNGYRLDRCEHCGHRFRWSRDARFGHTGSDKTWHGPCLSYVTWRTKAEEAHDVLALVMDVTGVTSRDMTTAAELRATSDDERIAVSSRTWRVFYETEKRQKASA
jgi:hypothetical protein